jgi:D-alanyl-D-alanine carboxypeptidase
VSALPIPADYAKRRGIRPQEEARDLVEVERSPTGRSIRLIPEAARAWGAMRDAARAEGVVLVAVSGFRSGSRQEEIIREKLSQGLQIGQILEAIAAPGYSEHHTGRAIDISTPGEGDLTEQFEQTDAYRWLKKNAVRFGFTLSYPRNNAQGFVFEPWHWLYSASHG